ncbi:MAG: RNA 2',3'-cyclic phosphodiesterase [Dehalococcoidia bacterium]|nr:RNA 2',3'-cyclic phosphodiesterase [Dehalococcoidia bacterium]
MSEEDEIRAFVAIELPTDLKKGLSVIIDGLKRNSYAPVKWVGVSGIHLTLKFLGQLPVTRIEEVQRAVTAACTGTGPLRLQITTLGSFPGNSQPRVIWAGLDGEVEKLSELASRIDTSITALGFPRESRPFTPHLTLGRVRPEAAARARSELGQVVLSERQPTGLSFVATGVSLMQSYLKPQGAMYTCLCSIPLRV